MANEIRDALTEVPREGARTLLAQAVEAEVEECLGRHRGEQELRRRGIGYSLTR